MTVKANLFHKIFPIIHPASLYLKSEILVTAIRSEGGLENERNIPGKVCNDEAEERIQS